MNELQQTPANLDWNDHLYRDFRDGASLESLAREYGRSEGQLRRLIRQEQYRRVLELSLDYMPNRKEFSRADADAVILAPAPQPVRTPRKARQPAGLPPYLASLYETQLLTAEQERHMFRKYNYLKYRASQLRASLDPQRPKTRVMNEIEDLHRQAVETKNQLVRANLRLVVSIAKKYVQGPDALFELVSEGNISLMRAVEKFDYALGNKFSTYATWAIKKNYARAYNNRMRQETRFRTSHEETLDSAAELRSNPFAEVVAQQQREADLTSIMNCLTDREREIVVKRFGLAGRAPAQTLQEVGADLGVTKERVRQIEKRALKKLREAAEQAHLESAAA